MPDAMSPDPEVDVPEIDITDWLAVHRLHDPEDEALHRRVCLAAPTEEERQHDPQ